MASWAEFAADAPQLADTVRRQFESHLHHIIGTIRPDGAPRLSGSEVHVRGGELTLGMMPGSRKLADVRRDARIEIHSAPVDVELAVGDVKVAGRVVEAPPPQGDDVPDGSFFRVDIDRVSVVRVEGNELVLMSWRPDRGLRETRRT